jgi:sulfite reductase alpha subunit-like flavoprotein
MLYFGCRSSSKDQHYSLEWQKYSLRQQLHYRVAFSRDRPEGEKKIYVQDLIEEDAEQIWNIVGVQKGWVFISGWVDFYLTDLQFSQFSQVVK